MQKETIHSGNNFDELLVGLTDFRAIMVARKLQNLPISNDYIDSLYEQLANMSYSKAE
jgi:hypothetical protein